MSCRGAWDHAMTMKGTNNIEQGFQNDGQHQANIHVDICCISMAELTIVLYRVFSVR